MPYESQVYRDIAAMEDQAFVDALTNASLWLNPDWLHAELEMLAWESTLPDLPTKQEILVCEGQMTDDSIERIEDFVAHRMMGGSKGEVIVVEGARFEMVDGCRIVGDIDGFLENLDE